jgi:hypothetical protein
LEIIRRKRLLLSKPLPHVQHKDEPSNFFPCRKHSATQSDPSSRKSG